MDARPGVLWVHLTISGPAGASAPRSLLFGASVLNAEQSRCHQASQPRRPGPSHSLGFHLLPRMPGCTFLSLQSLLLKAAPFLEKSERVLQAWNRCPLWLHTCLTWAVPLHDPGCNTLLLVSAHLVSWLQLPPLERVRLHFL